MSILNNELYLLEGPLISSEVLPCLEGSLLDIDNDNSKMVSEAVSRNLSLYDTRTHVVVELFNTEQSYVESLETVVVKYLNPLKSAENIGIVDCQTVDEIFLMVPSILKVHERFLSNLKQRLDSWDKLQRVGDTFVDVFSKSSVLETYATFVNNWNRAKDAIRSTRSSRPAFSKFLETMAREHKGKLSLDNLLIKPVQKFPNYELILSRLIKHTNIDHPDQRPLQEALKLVHDILLHLNCKERESLENGQREAVLREIETIIEGMTDLVTHDRQFLLFDLVSVIPLGQAGRKERGLFLFSDLLVITSIKRRSGTYRKPNINCPTSIASTLDTNKYKLMTKISLEDVDIVKAKDESVPKIMKEIEHLSEDYNKLQQMAEIASTIRGQHQVLEDYIKELQRDIQRQLADRQTTDSPLNLLELVLNIPNEVHHWSLIFSRPDKKTQWDQTFSDSKAKLATTMDRHTVPEFMTAIPIRKTRAGLQFTCAAPTLGNQGDVWVCNSDGYVGQVCVLSLSPEPTVTSCNGVCNARILCVASVPPTNSEFTSRCISFSLEDAGTSSKVTSLEANLGRCEIERKPNVSNMIDSCSSCEDSDNETSLPTPPKPPNEQTLEDCDYQQSTMWLGTEDGCIHVYNCTDNIRIKKNKINIQHINAVYYILYLDNRVFVSLANGEIIVYLRQQNKWNISEPLTVTLGTASTPVTRLLNVHGKLWCSLHGSIKVLETTTLQVEADFKVSEKLITNMVASDDFVWISLQNSAVIECYHSKTYGSFYKVNLALQVTKMLSNCDDIIKQHKAACLRVTSLLACKDLVWVGTSAGVLLTISSCKQKNSGSTESHIVTGLSHGHTGHVRFLTCVDYSTAETENTAMNKWKPLPKEMKPDVTSILIISGGDGYEDFKNSSINPLSEVAGREDSTNHLILWQV